MPEAINRLLIGSVEPNSGKSTLLLGMAQHWMKQNIDLFVGKPVALLPSQGLTHGLDEDTQLLQHCLGLVEHQVKLPLVLLDDSSVDFWVSPPSQNYQQQLQRLYNTGDPSQFGLLEGPTTLDEGRVIGLSLQELSDGVNAPILLVVRYQSVEVIDTILAAQDRLGDRLLGVVLNSVPPVHQQTVDEAITPFLEQQGIPIFGNLPYQDLLKSVSVAELARLLKAEVLCCPSRLNLMVGQLSIGAMNVNSALKFFRKGKNMAVVTGGARTDIQLAALESATHCLILTGHVLPNSIMISRAENLEVPVLSVALDTLSTVDIIEKAFNHARFHEAIKVKCIQTMIEQQIDFPRIFQKLGLSSVGAVNA